MDLRLTSATASALLSVLLPKSMSMSAAIYYPPPPQQTTAHAHTHTHRNTHIYSKYTCTQHKLKWDGGGILGSSIAWKFCWACESLSVCVCFRANLPKDKQRLGDFEVNKVSCLPMAISDAHNSVFELFFIMWHHFNKTKGQLIKNKFNFFSIITKNMITKNKSEAMLINNKVSIVRQHTYCP